jgi:hypothetical protein
MFRFSTIALRISTSAALQQTLGLQITIANIHSASVNVKFREKLLCSQ